MESITSPPSHTFRSDSFITPLMISIIGMISTAIAILLYHFILVKFFLRDRYPTAAAANSLPQESPTGVDEKVLEKIPIISYTTEKSHLFRLDQTECVVCLGELEHGEMVRLLPTCKHAFHVPCIDQWFVAHNSCPICRAPLVEPVTNDPAPPTPLALDIEEFIRRVQPLVDQESENGPSSSGQQSCGLLRHCASLMVPIDQRQYSRRRLVTGLKRSLSLDQSSVIIDIESSRNDGQECSSSSPKDDSVTRRLLLYRARSVNYWDRVSGKLLMRSFSRLRIGRNNEILPY